MPDLTKIYTATAAFSGMTSVMLGAFAAHGLKSRLSPALLETFQTGVHYQVIHALLLLYVGIIMRSQSAAIWSVCGAFLIAGTLLFSGSLYGLALGGPRWLGPVTPLGGLCFIVAWGCLFFASLRAM